MNAFTTRNLLICAALGVATALITIGLSPLTGHLAAAFPPAYALVAGYSAVAPLLLLRALDAPGLATVTAFCAGIIAWPFSAIGVLILIALLAPAATMDIVYLARRRLGQTRALWLAAFVGSIVIFTVSLSVFSPEHLTPLLLTLTLIARLGSYALACWAAILLARALRSAGVFTSARSVDAETAPTGRS